MSPVSKAALARFEAQFGKAFGEGAIERAGARNRVIVPTGSMLLDFAIRAGGLPVGRVFEAWGPPSVAKTTLGMIQAAEWQKAFPDKMIGWIDMERTFDHAWAEAHGVDLDRLWLTKPNSAEEVADQLKMLLESELCSFVTLDSVGGMIGKKEFEKDAEEVTVGLIAKIVTRMVKIATVRASQFGCGVMIINQARANIGGYGADTQSGGGFALGHQTTLVLQHKKTGEPPLTIGGVKNREIVGRTFAVLVAKNKLAPPNRTAMITLLNQPTGEYGPIGIDRGSEAFTLGELTEQFERAGAWYTLPDKTRHNGGDAVKAHLRAHPAVMEGIRETALAKVGHLVVPIEDELKEGALT